MTAMPPRLASNQGLTSLATCATGWRVSPHPRIRRSTISTAHPTTASASRCAASVSANNRPVGRIQLVNVRSPESLDVIGENLYRTTAASGAATTAAGARLTQGSIEASNVHVGDSMTEMIDAQRSFQLASRAVQMQDQMLQIANQVKS